MANKKSSSHKPMTKMAAGGVVSAKKGQAMGTDPVKAQQAVAGRSKGGKC